MKRYFHAMIFTLLSYFFLSVSAQIGTCRQSVNCRETVDDIIAMTTLEDCCLNTHGLAFSISGIVNPCTPCVVFGFLQDTFSGVEQEIAHRVQVGWQKGAEQIRLDLIFNVINTGITAREGSGLDYIISTNQVRLSYSQPNSHDNVEFIFRVDGIAQESNETLILTLVQAQTSAEIPTGSHVFFRNNATVTIYDSDDLGIHFSSDEFEANETPENGTSLPSAIITKVRKTLKIANPVTFNVIPLTVAQARASSSLSALLANIPDDNPFSPVFADMNDFNSTVIRVTFEADEDAEVTNDESFTAIPIVDDLVNEADIQVFIAQLNITNATNFNRIDLTRRPSSICRIINNDVIRIGFVLPQYTYIEPMFDTTIDELDYTPPTNRTANGFIYITTEDSVVSEQTFQIIVRVSDSVPPLSGFTPAVLNVDYGLESAHGTSQVLQFPARIQKKLFSFTLFSDHYVEKTKAFLISLDSEDSTIVNGIRYSIPRFLSPQKLSRDTFVIIEDDDPILIGFEQRVIRANESVGILDVFVHVSNLVHNDQLDFSAEVAIITTSINATKGIDYEKVNSNKSNGFLIFDDTTHRQSFQVMITDDINCETVESFTVELGLNLSSTTALLKGVMLFPNMTTVYILDDDNITIGFISPPYLVSERDAILSISVGILQGSLQQEVVINISTSDSTAIDTNDFNGLHTSLTFGPESTRFQIRLSIVDDIVYELNEQLTASLLFAHPYNYSAPKVSISPAFASITIIDDDAITIGFEQTSYTVNETDLLLSLRVTLLDGMLGPSQNIQVRFITSDETAQAPSDYSQVYSTLMFSSSFTMQAVDVVIHDDSLREVDEVFYVRLQLANGYDFNRVLLQPNEASVSIIDSDSVVIGFTQQNYIINEAADVPLNITVEVTSGQLDAEIVLDINTRSGSAKSSLDYNDVVDLQLTFTSSITSRTFLIEIINDALYEEEEKNFTVSLSTHEQRVHFNNQTTTICIIDDDSLIIGFLHTLYAVNESQGSVNIEVGVMNQGLFGRDVVINIATSDSTAFARDDYMGFDSLLLTFYSNVTKVIVPIMITNDDAMEAVETLSAHLSFQGVHTPRVILAPNSTRVEIRDDDEVEIGFSSHQYVVSERDVQLNLHVQVTSGTLQTKVTFNFYTVEQAAHAGEDFTAPDLHQFSLNFSQSIQITVPLINDNIFELSESFIVYLSSNTTSEVLLFQSSATVTILDDDELIFGLSQTTYKVSENDGFVSVHVIFYSGATEEYQPVINLSTSNGSANGNTDFKAVISAQVIFSDGNRLRTQNISIFSSSSTEELEEFSISLDMVTLLHSNNHSTLTLSEWDNSRLILDPREANITITDNDVAIIGFLNSTLNTMEGENLYIMVGVLQGTLDVLLITKIMFTTEDVTAKGGHDYDKTNSIIDFTGESVKHVSIRIIADDLLEPSEKFYGKISALDSNSLLSNILLEPSRIEVIITEHDQSRNKSDISLAAGITVVACVVFFVFVVIIIIVAAVKGKRSNIEKEKKSNDEHNYESVSDLPMAIPLEPVNKNNEIIKSVYSSIDQYDYIQTDELAIRPTVFKLVENDAYKCSSFKPDNEPATKES